MRMLFLMGGYFSKPNDIIIIWEEIISQFIHADEAGEFNCIPRKNYGTHNKIL